MKKCFKCGESKDFGEFYRHPRMLDGHLGKCKECTKNDVRENRLAKVNAYREYDKKRYRDDPSVRARIARTSAAWADKHPERRRAHYLVGNAVRDGRLEKGVCVVCGAKNVHGHHEDYSKPLDVIWLCPPHHRMWHLSGPIPFGAGESGGDEN